MFSFTKFGMFMLMASGGLAATFAGAMLYSPGQGPTLWFGVMGTLWLGVCVVQVSRGLQRGSRQEDAYNALDKDSRAAVGRMMAAAERHEPEDTWVIWAGLQGQMPQKGVSIPLRYMIGADSDKEEVGADTPS